MRSDTSSVGFLSCWPSDLLFPEQCLWHYHGIFLASYKASVPWPRPWVKPGSSLRAIGLNWNLRHGGSGFTAKTWQSSCSLTQNYAEVVLRDAAPVQVSVVAVDRD